MKICKRIISCFICVLLLLQEISVNVNAMTIDRKTNGSYCIDLEEGDNGLYYPKYDNNKQYAKQLQQWIDTLGYSEYFSDYTNKKDIEELLNETIEVPMVDDNNNMYLLESDIKVKELLAYIVFVEQAQSYAADMERDMLEEKSTSGSFSMDYEEFYNDLVAFYDTYITFEATVNGREELNRKLGLALCSRTAIEAVKNIKGVNTAYKYLGDYTRITYKADSDTDDVYYYIMSGGDSSQYNSYIEKKLENVDDFITRLKGIKTTYKAFSGGDKIGTVVAGIKCFRDFSGHKYDNIFTKAADAVVNAKSVLDGLNLLCENPWLFGMKEGVKFTTKYIEEVKKLIDSAEKKNAGWYATCIYNMYGSHDEALNSIINTNTLEVYNIFDSACNFPDDNTDGIYQKLITDYQNKFAAYGEGASLYMPEKSTRLQLIKAALLLKRMKEYDATELKESLIESLIAKLDLTAEYSLSADVKEISFGSFYKGDNVAAEDITITNTSAYSVTLMEEATIYFDSTNVNGKVLQPGETVVISVKPRTGSWTDGYYEEKLTLYCKEEPEAGLKVNLCMMLKDKQAENVQLAEKAPIEIGSNQILKIKNNQCILVEGDGKETVQEDIKDLLYCGVILKGGKLQVYNDVYIKELEYIKGSIEGFNNAMVTIDKLITQNGSGGLYFKGATYRVYSDATIKRNISTTSETTVVFEKNLETSEISIGNGDFEIYGKTTGRIKMGSGDFICRGDYEGGITMGTGKVRICGTFQQSQLLAMHSENAELYVEKNWNAYGRMLTSYDETVDAGTITIKGDIYTSGNDLCIAGKAKLYLSGGDGQKIISDNKISSMYMKYRSYGAGIYSYIRNIETNSRVEIQNCWIGKLDSGIKLSKNTTGLVVENGNYNRLNVESGCDGNFMLVNCNVEYEGDTQGGFYFEGCNVAINGNCIANSIVGKNRNQTCCFLLDDSNAIIKKNLITNSIEIGSGCLDVKEDFTYKSDIGMHSSDAYICVNGNVYANGCSGCAAALGSSTWLTDGVLEVKGDLIAKDNWYDSSGWGKYYYSFDTRDNFTLLLTGDGIQTIDIPTDSKIVNLSQGEKSILQLEKGLTISQLKSDIKIKDIEKTLLVINGNENQVELLSGCTGNINVKKTIIKANTDIALGSLELSNSSAQIVGKINASRIEVNDASKIAISKDCETKSLLIENGNMEIGGDCTTGSLSLRNSRVEIAGDCAYTGSISMKNSEDYLEIGGNLYANGYSYKSGDYYLTNGTMELYGDIIARDNWSEKGSYYHYYYHPFDTKDGFKLLMTGDGVQTISIPENNKIANLSQGEMNVLQLEKGLAVNNLSTDLRIKDLGEGLSILNGNEKQINIIGECTGNINITNCSLKADSNINSKSINMHSSSGQIVGDCITGSLYMGNSKLEITGDCTYTGSISMKNAEDYLKIGGNLYANGYSRENSYYLLTNGTMEIHGDIVARDNWSETIGYYHDYYYPFDTKDDFKLLMTGDGVQTISIPANNQVANLQQGEKSIIQASNNLNITNLQSDCHMENVAKATIKNWNDYTLTNARCSGEIKFSYPNNYSYSVSQDEEQLYTSVYKPEQLSRPTSNISNGSTVELNTVVKLKQGNSRATIYYTLDGSDPTRESIQYTEPIILTQDTRIRCMAVMDGVEDSDIAEYTYTIRRYQVAVASDVPEGLLTADTAQCIEGTKVRIQIGEIRGRSYKADTLKVRRGSASCEVLEDEDGYYFYMPKGNVTIQADYENKQYAIIYHMDGGDIETPVDSYTYSEGCELPIPIKEGYRFEGWYEEETYAGDSVTFIGTDEIGEKEYWAKWQEKEEITVDSVVQTVVYDEEGQVYTVQTDSVQTGYEIRYYMNGERIDSPIESGIYDVQIIRPEDDTYKKVDVQITGGLVIKKADVQVITQPTVKDIKTGDALQNAIIDINSDAQVVSAENEKLPVYGIFEWEEPDTVVGASGDYYAVFQPVNENYNSCRILLPVIASSEMHKLSMSDAMEHGRLQFSADEALPGEQITVTVVPETGYHWTQELDEVTVIYNGKQLKNLEYVGENQFRIEMPASDTSIKVEMQLNTYSVTKECDTEQGKLEGPEQVQHGETATYRAVPEEGYLIKDILVNGKSVYTGSDTVTVPEIQADIQISVTFEKKKVIFTYGTYEHGSITAYADDRKVLDGDILEYGTILTLEILPEEGYEIKELTYDDNPVVNRTFRLKDTDEIVAIFGKTQETLDKEALAAEKEKLCTEQTVLYATYPGLEELLYPESVAANPEIEYRIQNAEEVKDYVNADGTIIYRNDDPDEKQVTIHVQMNLGNAVDETEIMLRFPADTNEYAVTVTEQEHGKIVPVKSYVRYGEEICYQAVPDEGYQMKVGSLRVNGTLTEKAVMAHEDVVLSAEFERIKCHIELDVSTGGRVTGDTEVLYGDEAKFLVESDPYYYLDSIKINGVTASLTNGWLEINNIHQNTKVQLIFKRKSASFYVEPLEHGTILVQQESKNMEHSSIVDQGKPIVITVKPDVGYKEVPGSLTVNGKTVKDHSYFVVEDTLTIRGAVMPIKTERIQLSKTSVILTKGKSITLGTTVTPMDALNKSVTWASSNTKVATVDSTGKVTAKAVGAVTITCTAKDGSGVKATCKVTVKNPVVKVSKITLNKTSASLVKGDTLALKATVTPTNATNKAVTWKSSNTKIATVSSSGKVTAKAAGTVTITCTAKDGSGKKATCKITVYNNTQAYVARIYTKALGRAAEPAGLNYWTNEIQSGKRTPVKVAEEFFFAPEFTNKNLNNTEYVKVLYRTFMGREYDKGGLDYWVGRLNKGESRKSVLEAFAGCPEFRKIVKSFGL